MNHLVLLAVLFVLGTTLILLSMRGRQKSVTATAGSVAIGGNNSGNVSASNTGAPSHGSHSILLPIGIVIDLGVIVLGVIDLLHKAGK